MLTTLLASQKVMRLFFLHSNKGKEAKDREARKRGGNSKIRGISNDQVAVIVTQDRKSTLDLSVVTLGRIKKVDIKKAIGKRVSKQQTILCSDAHVSYKGFAMDCELEHHTLKGVTKERVKEKVYHIQHVNSTHNKVKKWIESTFWGVATKYLQQYLNWYRFKEKLKHENNKLKVFTEKVCQNSLAYQKYLEIENNYQILISTQ